LHTKVREEHEARYVSEYILEKFPERTYKLRAPLGGPPPEWVQEMGEEKALRTYRPYRPEVDAIVIEEDRLILIEGKILKVMDGISKLPVYRFLVPVTPELAEYHELEIEARLVTPHPPFWAEQYAKHADIIVDIWEPEWIQEYHKRMDRYWTKEARAERAKRKEVLKGLGFR